VVFCDLSSDTVEDDLNRHQAYDRVRGVRQIIGRAPAEDAKSGTPALLENPVWRQNLARLGPRGLRFDLQLTPAQYEAALPVLAAASETPIVICHAGSPWDQSAEGFAFWRGAMARFAELDHVMCKVSGLGMFDAGWTAEGFQPWFDVLMERFGAERLMFGSNFPVDKLYGGYERVWLAFDRLSAGLSDAERAALFAGTAQRFYALS
jgi:predicted TIM-barrel fold metal-dependent hydrolase